MVHEVFIAVWENREKMDENKSFSGFIFSIARNKALNRIKQNLTGKVYLEYMEMEHQVQNDIENVIESRELMDYHQVINKSLKSSLSLTLVNNEEFFKYPLQPFDILPSLK